MINETTIVRPRVAPKLKNARTLHVERDITVRARVEPKLKDDAELVLSTLGVSMSDAIRMYLTQISLRRGIPFSVEIPNAETLEAMREAEAGKTECAGNVADLFAKLRK